MADFLKGLGPNEYYDIAQKTYNQWEKTTKSAAVGFDGSIEQASSVIVTQQD